MCTRVMVKDKNGEWDEAETVGELTELLGITPAHLALKHGEQAIVVVDECLCSVDVPETAARRGFDCESGWDDLGCDFKLTPN